MRSQVGNDVFLLLLFKGEDYYETLENLGMFMILFILLQFAISGFMSTIRSFGGHAQWTHKNNTKERLKDKWLPPYSSNNHVDQ